MFTVQAGDLPLFGTDEFGVLWGVSEVEGWGPTGSTASQTQRPRQSGAWSGAKLAKARAVTVTGGFTAPSPEAAQTALDRLGTAISRQEFPLIVTETTSPRWGLFYQTGELIPTWINSTQVDWSFQVASDDWRKFGTDLAAATTLPSTFGGLTIAPMSGGADPEYMTAEQANAAAGTQGRRLTPAGGEDYYDVLTAAGQPATDQYLASSSPVTGGLTVGFTVDATTVTGQVSLVNPGNEPGPVRLRIDGPCVGPVITHVSTGAQLVFSSSLVLRAGEWLEVDMESRTVLANGQSSRAGWITSRGWSQFDPGRNTWSFTAASFTSAARLTVTATPSWK